MKTAGKINKALGANDEAMRVLTASFDLEQKSPSFLKGTQPKSYVAAAEAGANLPKKHPMLKMPLSKAAAKAKTMSKEDFVFGPAKVAGEDIPVATFYKEGVVSEIPEKMQNAWNTIASRYPKTAARYSNLIEELVHNGSFVSPGNEALSGLPHLTQGAVALSKNAGPTTLLHELVHAAQSKLGIMQKLAKDPDTTRAVSDMALEPTAWRRSIESEMAKALYKYGNAVQDVPSQSPLVAALLGHNAGRSGAYL
jgi:hypothetical protein